jgi:hypothetical protein
MSEGKTDTVRQTCQTIDLVFKTVQTLILLGILISLAVLTNQLRGFSPVLSNIANHGSFPVVISGQMPDVGVSGVVSITNQPNSAFEITNDGDTVFKISSTA